MSFVNSLTHKFSRTATNLDPSQFLLVVACVLLVGLVCMRGYGSRTNW